MLRKQEPESIAICVCSSGARESLKACLASLVQQQLSDSYSVLILVIDNSADGDISAAFEPLSEGIKFCRESRQGIPFARNAALREAVALNASYIAFIDDDEIAPKNWLCRLLEGLKLNDADVIVGEVGRCESLEVAVDSAAEYKANSNLNDLTAVKTAVTSNVLFKTELVCAPLSIDFDENMVFGGSDREFFMRVALAGKKIVSAKDNVVFETWPQERREVAYLLMRWLRYGVSFNYRYSKNLNPGKAIALIWLMFFYKLLGAPIKLAVVPIRKIWDKRSLKKLIGMSVADVAYALGCISPYFGLSLKKYY